MARSMVDGPVGAPVRLRGVTVGCCTHSSIVSPDAGTAVRPSCAHQAANAARSAPYARRGEAATLSSMAATVSGDRCWSRSTATSSVPAGAASISSSSTVSTTARWLLTTALRPAAWRTRPSGTATLPAPHLAG